MEMVFIHAGICMALKCLLCLQIWHGLQWLMSMSVAAAWCLLSCMHDSWTMHEHVYGFHAWHDQILMALVVCACKGSMLTTYNTFFCHAWACFMDHAWHAWGSCKIFLTLSSCHVYRLQRLSGKQKQHAYDFSFMHAWFHGTCRMHESFMSMHGFHTWYDQVHMALAVISCKDLCSHLQQLYFHAWCMLHGTCLAWMGFMQHFFLHWQTDMYTAKAPMLTGATYMGFFLHACMIHGTCMFYEPYMGKHGFYTWHHQVCMGLVICACKDLC